MTARPDLGALGASLEDGFTQMFGGGKPEAVMPDAGFLLTPDSQWPCAHCSVVTTQHDGGYGRVFRRISHLQTCSACRAAGAPDTLPWR